MPEREPIRSLAFLLTDDGDLSMSTIDGVLDFDLVEDDEEVIQSLRNILLTRLGTDLIHPEIGLPQGIIAAVGEEAFVAGAVSRALQTDDRVGFVEKVTAAFRDSSARATRNVNIDVTVVLKDGRFVSLGTTLGV